jgi:hypothetical protein
VADDEKFGFLAPTHGRPSLGLFLGFQKLGDAAVVGALHLGGEVAGRQFAGVPVVAEAFAADAFARARFIGAGALGQVGGLVGAFWHL